MCLKLGTPESLIEAKQRYLALEATAGLPDKLQTALRVKLAEPRIARADVEA